MILLGRGLVKSLAESRSGPPNPRSHSRGSGRSSAVLSAYQGIRRRGLAQRSRGAPVGGWATLPAHAAAASRGEADVGVAQSRAPVACAAMPSFETVRYEVADGVATIAMDQPESRNALSDALLRDLIARLRGRP